MYLFPICKAQYKKRPKRQALSSLHSCAAKFGKVKNLARKGGIGVEISFGNVVQSCLFSTKHCFEVGELNPKKVHKNKLAVWCFIGVF